MGVPVLQSDAGRAKQMNFGAMAATGDYTSHTVPCNACITRCNR